MPMTKAGLSAEIITKLNAQFGTPADSTSQQEFADAVADAVVSYIQANMTISTNDTGAVTSGVGAGGTVVATGVGTAS
jgi:hypothetical protein